MMGYDDILKMFVYVYLMILFLIVVVYLRTMYVQYKNAHDKWYDIDIEYKKKDESSENIYNANNPEYLINQID